MLEFNMFFVVSYNPELMECIWTRRNNKIHLFIYLFVNLFSGRYKIMGLYVDGPITIECDTYAHTLVFFCFLLFFSFFSFLR